MKKLFPCLALAMAAFILQPAPSSAADNPKEKFTRGVINVISAPLEIAKQIDHELKSDQPPTKKLTVGVFSGLFKGLGHTVTRMGSGAWDIVSFPFKFPKNYDPLVKPEYVLEKEKSKP